MMTEELLAAIALLVQSGALYWSVIISAPAQEAAKLFQQQGQHLKGNYDLNSAFEKADRLLQ